MCPLRKVGELMADLNIIKRTMGAVSYIGVAPEPNRAVAGVVIASGQRAFMTVTAVTDAMVRAQWSGTYNTTDEAFTDFTEWVINYMKLEGELAA